jgi:hypothetical protein
MLRNKCVICENCNLSDVFDIIGTINTFSTDIFLPNEIETLNFVGCLKCGCIQLKNLFDPSKIYSQPMQCINGTSLNEHYKLFCDFIIKNKIVDDYSFFEIGGAYGRLAKLIINYYKNINNINIKYKILEFDTTNYPPIENIDYINGNCETYNFKNIKTLIMSHVFEHLYEPRLFLKNISESNVSQVFISIPDMESLSKLGDINNLNIYHTFYIDTKFITYLFNEYNYILKNTYNYSNNSIFYYFVKEQRTITNDFMININDNSLISIQCNFYKEIKNKINNIIIEQPFFICPSGLYGRFIYYYLNENVKKHVLGFLDSDPMKIDKRLCGTNCLTYKKEKIIEYEKPIILIVSKKHYNELKDELILHNNKSIFYHL